MSNIYLREIISGKTTVAIFTINPDVPSHEFVLENTISDYVGNRAYNSYKDVNVENTYVRVVIIDEEDKGKEINNSFDLKS